MIAAGLVPASKGTVKIAVQPVNKPYTDVGFVFQRDLLFDWRTVLGNVLLQADIRRNMARDVALQKARALLRHDWPVGLREPLSLGILGWHAPAGFDLPRAPA